MDVRPHPEPSQMDVSTAPSSASRESRLQLLVETGLLLAREQSPEGAAQSALAAGQKLCGAAVGALFYVGNTDEEQGHQLFEITGLTAKIVNKRLLPPSNAFVVNAFLGSSPRAIRLADLSQQADSRYRSPFEGEEPERTAMRSYLAIPIQDRIGENLGVIAYGHPEAGMFSAEAEALVSTLAAQAAIAIANARLALSLSSQLALSAAAQKLQHFTADRLRQALDAAGLGTFTWDRESDLLDLDERAAQLFNAPPGVPVSRSSLRDRLVIPEDREQTRERLRKAIASDGAYKAEYRVAAPDGAISWLSTNGVSTRNGNTVTGMIGVVQNVTDRKTQEAALRQSERLAATGRLAASIAHEINNPLEAVTNLIYLVKTDPELPASLEQLLEIADTELARVGQIAQQTLGFYRDTSYPAEIDLSSLLSAVIQLFSRKLGHKRLQCTLDLEPNLRLFGFAGEMRQIFSNLLVNAIDASSSGTIQLRARSRNLGGHPGVVVLLSDPGMGISEQHRKRMFSPFFTTKESTGTGLGLWVTRGMVEKHGGRIHFRSRTQHPTGTVFRVHLPQAFPSAGRSSSHAELPIQ